MKRMRDMVVTGLMAVGVLASLATSRSEELPLDPGPTDDRSAAVRKVFGAYCQLAARCEPQWGALADDAAHCEAFWQAQFECGSYALAAVDATQVDGLVTAFQQRSCATPFHLMRIFDDFRPFLTDPNGHGSGTACQSTQCAAGLFCQASASAGVCATCAPVGTVNAACENSGSATECQVGLVCDSTKKCNALKPDGAACTAFIDCQSGACTNGLCGPQGARDADCATDRPCNGFLICSAGRCTDRPGANAPCTNDCTLGNSCVDGTCVARGYCAPAAVGERCSMGGCAGDAYCYGTGSCAAPVAIDGDCSGYRQCVNGAYCSSSSQTCAWPVALDGDCAGGKQCAAGAFCANGSNRCQAVLANDETCTNHEQCASALCDRRRNSTCQPRGANGTACQNPLECESNYCDSTLHCAAAGSCTMP